MSDGLTIAHPELELGQGGQLPHQAQRRQLRLHVVVVLYCVECQNQLVHASQEALRH
jgi:cytochrome c-type biogenesis protein CcmH/NrfF